MTSPEQRSSPPPPIFVVSGGPGALGKHVARIALSQFPKVRPELIVFSQVRRPEQLTEAIEEAAKRGGIILHTMVNAQMREALLRLAAERNLRCMDTVGEAIAHMQAVFGQEPLGEPGLYHGQEEIYLERIRAIEYTVDHDDGRDPQGLREADIVLTGVSRVGKTPLSVYLSVLGWKVANVPLVPGIDPPEELFQIDSRRVIGLVIDEADLAQHRHWRQRSMGHTAGRSYTDFEHLHEELDMAKRVFRRGGFTVVDVSGKPVEETADEVISRITRWFERKVKLPPLGERR